MSDYVTHIVAQAIGTLRRRPENARTHSKKQVRMIADSITAFGFLSPLLIDKQHNVIAGHGRLEAATLLGLPTVPTISVSHLTPAKLRAFAVADNRLAELAGWDRELLALEVLSIEDLDDELDLTLTGFDIDDIELFRDVVSPTVSAEQEAPPAPDFAKPATTATGDLWVIGEHRLKCGDARSPEAFGHLMDGSKADLVITDPPFNVPIQGHVSGLGKARHSEFAMASGEMTRQQFQRFLLTVLKLMSSASRSGSLHYIFMDWRHIADLLAAGEATYHRLINLVVWAKRNGGMGSFYRSQHELIAVFQNGRRAHLNRVELGKNGRNRTNVWSYAGANSFGPTRDADLAMHPTVKPQVMLADAIKDASDPGDLVLDPFAGSGATLFASHDTGRRARLIEIDPHYCDLIVRRSIAAGLPVTSAETGVPYATVAANRAGHSSCPQP